MSLLSNFIARFKGLLLKETTEPGNAPAGFRHMWFDSVAGAVKFKNSAGTVTSISGGAGDVVGPGSAVNNNFAAFDGTTGKLIKDSGSAAATFAAASHSHSGSDITSGTVAAARLGSGTPSANNVLRGDGSWGDLPAAATGVSFLRRNQGHTKGSTMTNNLIYGTAEDSRGSGFTYNTDATNGDSVTVAAAGVYRAVLEVMCVSGGFGGAAAIKRGAAASQNNNMNGTDSDQVAWIYLNPGDVSCVSAEFKCSANDQIWFQFSGSIDTNYNKINYFSLSGPY